ncbi:MAG TPA: N-acetylmuramoyl-L-alanine amidase [bacterium]|nr:N-acetylmuramoyl-L-alanine amidase [bacterium]
MTNLKAPWIRRALFAAFWALGAAAPLAAGDDSATLKYTYRPDQGSVRVLRDKDGKGYLPLMDTAKFYGIEVSFDPQTRKVLLKKGGRVVKVILDQPLFLLENPAASAPMDPLEMLSGELALPVESSGDLLGAVLNINARYLADSQTVAVGGVKEAELRQEILSEAKGLTPSPTPEFLLSAAPTATPAAMLMAPPTPTPALVVEAEPTLTPAPVPSPEDLDETPAPVPGRDELAPAKNVYQVRRIIIDAGHGGIDNGARGFDKKYVEKQATLDIARRVAGILNAQKDLDVFLTRKGDYYITLKYRTTFANNHNGDLFVSIHCNANPNTQAFGTETYFYSNKASNQAAEVAAVHENGGDSTIDSMLNDLHNQAYRQRSFKLAELVDAHIRQRMGQHIRRIQQAPFYVLARVNMPSILVETAFITNPKEEDKLKSEQWRDNISHAIADGILDYKAKVEGSFANQTSTQ